MMGLNSNPILSNSKASEKCACFKYSFFGKRRVFIFTGEELIYNTMLVSAVQKVNRLYIYTYPPFFRFFSHTDH